MLSWEQEVTKAVKDKTTHPRTQTGMAVGQRFDGKPTFPPSRQSLSGSGGGARHGPAFLRQAAPRWGLAARHGAGLVVTLLQTAGLLWGGGEVTMGDSRLPNRPSFLTKVYQFLTTP